MSSIKLVIENNYSTLHADDKEINNELWKLLRFRDKNYYHNSSYKLKLWDGYVDFFQKETGRFLTGLLPEVKLVLKQKFNIKDIEIIDKRVEIKFPQHIIDKNWMSAEKKDFSLRDYQVDLINLSLKYKRGIIPTPTGSGKTNVMIGIVKAIPEEANCLILANQKILVEQNYEELNSCNIPCGILYGNKKKDLDQRIICATSQTLIKYKEILDRCNVLIVDEIHDMMSAIPKKIYRACKNAFMRIGMSATAFKFGGSDKVHKYEVKGWFGPLFHTEGASTKELQEKNILSLANCVFYRIREPQLDFSIYIDAVTKGIAENETLSDAIDKIVSRNPGRTLILVERIDHGDRLLARHPDWLWVQGKDDNQTRKKVINGLKTNTGNLVAIATQKIFNTGVNVFLHNLINAAGGQATHQIIQRFGRGLRVSSDKEMLNYFDFYFDINQYLLNHSVKRMNILKKEGHPVSLQEL